MCKFVIKKDGTKEPYNSKKIERAIASAAIESNMREVEILNAIDETCQTIDNTLIKLHEVTTRDIRDMILSSLDKKWPRISECWREYEKEYTKRLSS